MPASMISELRGASPYVAGSSIAMVATGPMPGSTPMRVPSRHPARQKNRFCAVAAAANPTIRLLTMSMSAAPEYRQRLPQAIDKDDDTEQRERDGERDRLLPFGVARREGADQRHNESGGGEAGALDQHREHKHGDKNHEARVPPAGCDRRTVDRDRPQPDRGAEDEEADAQQHGHVARSHARDAADVVVAAEPKPGEADGDQDDRGPSVLRALDAQRHGWACARMASARRVEPIRFLSPPGL